MLRPYATCIILLFVCCSARYQHIKLSSEYCTYHPNESECVASRRFSEKDFEVIEVEDGDSQMEEANWYFDREKHCWALKKYASSEIVHSEDLFPQIFCESGYRFKLKEKFRLHPKPIIDSQSPSQRLIEIYALFLEGLDVIIDVLDVI